MSATRCPSCAAAVRPDDPWCTLCYANLRPEPAPAAELVTVPPTAPTESTYSLPPLPPRVEPVVDPADPLGTAAPVGVGEPAPVTLPRWTCVSCGTSASYDELVCPTCGRALLADDTPALPTLVTPGSTASKAGVIFGGMAIVMAVLMALLFLIGSVI